MVNSDESYRIRLRKEILLLGAHATSTQIAKTQETRTTLKRRIECWRLVQDVYIPVARGLRAATIDPSSLKDEPTPPERLRLLLPSSLPPSIRFSPALASLVDKEFRLRRAQAQDALRDLRQSLCVRWHLLRQKRSAVRGQRANTRANTVIAENSARTNRHADRYRRARAALDALGPNRDGWKSELLKLEDTDIQPLHQGRFADDEKQRMKTRSGTSRSMQEEAAAQTEPGSTAVILEESEGRRRISWIWMAPGVLAEGGDEAEVVSDSTMGEGEYGAVQSYIIITSFPQ